MASKQLDIVFDGEYTLKNKGKSAEETIIVATPATGGGGGGGGGGAAGSQ